mgnify:FL=1
MEIKSAALIGVGAVGSYFAYGLPAKLGDRFCVIASGKRKERLEQELKEQQEREAREKAEKEGKENGEEKDNEN